MKGKATGGGRKNPDTANPKSAIANPKLKTS
jgi:hypothetical protein